MTDDDEDVVVPHAEFLACRDRRRHVAAEFKRLSKNDASEAEIQPHSIEPDPDPDDDDPDERECADLRVPRLRLVPRGLTCKEV